MKEKLWLGIDAGSSGTKAVVIDENKNIKGYSVRRSGIDFSKAAELCLDESLKMTGASFGQIENSVLTGYGRKSINVDMPNSSKTEISCHATGCYHYFHEEITIIDIGGQDNKLIKLDQKGRRISFKMNRKCAAGTGAFLEEMALRLDIPISEMNRLAEKSENMVVLGSFCTVFSATEVLENIQKGKKIYDIVKGIFYSVVKRVFEMDSLSGRLVMTGGVVAHNPFIAKMAEEASGKRVAIPTLPQFTGAMGAALYALRNGEEL